jgi:hypothetical protein
MGGHCDCVEKEGVVGKREQEIRTPFVIVKPLTCFHLQILKEVLSMDASGAMVQKTFEPIASK